MYNIIIVNKGTVSTIYHTIYLERYFFNIIVTAYLDRQFIC